VLYHFTKDAPECTIHWTRIKSRMSSLKDKISWREHEADSSLAGVGICTFFFAL